MGRHPLTSFGYLLQFLLSLLILLDRRLLPRQGGEPAGPLDHCLVGYHHCPKERQLRIVIRIGEV